MPEETETTTPETKPEPAPEAETTAEPEAAPAEKEPDLESPEAKYWQGAFTQARQKDTERIRSLEERLDRMTAALEARTPQVPEGAPAAGETQFDRVFRSSQAYQALVKEVADARRQAETARVEARIEAAKTKVPEIARRESEFVAYLQEKPAMARALRDGELGFEEVFGAFTAAYPAKPSRGGVKAPLAKPAPTKVEGASSPGGVPLDSRAIARNKAAELGKPLNKLSATDVFDEMAQLATREVSAAG